MYPAYASINYVAKIKEMVAAEPSMFRSPGGLQRKAAQVVVAALLASEEKIGSPQNPRFLETEAEGGSVRVLGPLPIGTSASLVSTPTPHLCASSECY